MKTFDIFPTYSGLKPNKSKCEIAVLGALKGVKLTLCGMECIEWNEWNIVYYSYDKNLENQESFINLFLKLSRIWRMRNVSIAGIVHLALVKVIPISTILELDKIKKHFIWKNGNPKIKQDTLCKDYENVGLKKVGITFKIISLQCSSD